MSSEAKWSDFQTLDPARTIAAANRLLPFWVSLALVVVIGWQLAMIAWTLVPAPAVGGSVTAPAGQFAATRTADPGFDAQRVASANLFGRADPADAAPAPPPDESLGDLENTGLSNLALKGTIASDRREYSVAIIADGGNEEKIYVIGDPITSNATLHAVFTDRVVLNENGNLTNLRLPEESPSGSATSVRRTPPTRTVIEPPPDSIQAVVSQNVARLADVIRPTPYFVNGQQQGYRVYPGRDRRQFAELGLRPGDLILDIDGQSLTDPTQAMEIFQSLGTASEVSVTVERDGTPEVIVLRTSQLDLSGEQTQ